MAIYMMRDVTPITTAGIYHNSDLWLISLSSDGSNWTTIADKNLWATTVYNYWDTLTINNTWNVYQSWNNHSFPSTLDTSTTINSTTTTVNASTYWPWNYYNSSTFIKAPVWDNSNNNNLWGWTTWTNAAMQWPCESWWHVPQYTEMQIVIQFWTNLGIWDANNIEPCLTYLKIPLAWFRSTKVSPSSVWTECKLECCNMASWFGHFARIKSGTMSWWAQSWTWNINWQVRPFKNDAVQPDSSRTVIYQ